MSLRISFVTVVYQAELGQLRLQAMSMAKFLAPQRVEDIIIFVNDLHASEVRAALENNLDDYGDLRAKVKIYNGDDIFGPMPKPIRSFRQALVESPLFAFLRRKQGWKGNKGHFMQQAFKLAAWKVAGAENIVILDAKNIFIKHVNEDWFFDGSRARASLVPPGHLHKRWLLPSFRTFGLKFGSQHLSELYTTFVTPYAIKREFLRKVCETFEQQYLPVQVAFGSKNRNIFLRHILHYTEFMIINAYCFFIGSKPQQEFSGGLIEADSFFPSTTSEKADAIISKMEKDEVSILGLHSSVVRRLSNEQIERLSLGLQRAGIADEVAKIDSIIRESAGLTQKL